MARGRGTRVGLGVALLAALVGGCAPTVWTKPGATEAEFHRDSYQCRQENTHTAVIGYGSGYGSVSGGTGYGEWSASQGTTRVTDWVMYARCMQARGWQQVKP